MKNEIQLIKNNNNREDTDLEWINEFYRFLQGETPEGMSLGYGSKLKLTKRKAFAIIWYLQEHFCLLPDHIEQCSDCGELYDSHSSGYHSEKRAKFYCEGCIPPFIDEEDN